jgi:hypothetical protein
MFTASIIRDERMAEPVTVVRKSLADPLVGIQAVVTGTVING